MPGQNSPNLVKITDAESGVPCVETTPARHQVEITGFAGIGSVKFKDRSGTEHTASLGSVITDVDELTASLYAAAQRGVYDNGLGSKVVGEGDGGGITVTDLGSGTVRITIDADFEIVAFVKADGTDETVDRSTVRAKVAKQGVIVEVGAIATVGYDGTDQALATGTYASGSAATLKGDVETALAALNVEFTDVVVTEDEEAEKFDIEIHAIQKPISIDGTEASIRGGYYTFLNGSDEIIEEIKDGAAEGVDISKLDAEGIKDMRKKLSARAKELK